MPSRRISAPDILAPQQEISVNPYSSYNSDNVNMLTRIVTGKKDQDFVINGLDVEGVNRISTEITDDTPIVDTFNYSTLTDLQLVWDTENIELVDVSGNKKVRTQLDSNVKYARCKLKYRSDTLSSRIGQLFKIQFTTIGTPSKLHVQLGSEIFTYKYPNSGDYTLYMELASRDGSYQNLSFFIDIDQLDQYCDQQVTLDDITVTRVVNRGEPILPITDPTVDALDIPEKMLHPHESLTVYPGVCVKDETMINFTGTNNSDPTIPVCSLVYGDSSSWIGGASFSQSDFTGQSQFWSEGGINNAVPFSNGELFLDSLDDGEVDGPRKIEGNAGIAQVKWAYLCVYYSYFKNPNPNRAYIGIATEEEINDARYGEDYLILAKLRFIDKSTVDAIIYYPERHDWGFIDATRVTYLHLSTLKHWLNRPLNVSLALDELAYQVYNIKGCLYFQTNKQFIDWRNKTLPTGVGHGPHDYMQKRSGSDPENSYDMLAYVVETNTFWRSRLDTLQQIDIVEITNSGNGYTIASVSFDGGIGSGAKLIPVLSSGVITSIEVQNSGTNYAGTSIPVIISGSSGINAAATAYIVDGKINNVDVTNGGSGYISDAQATLDMTSSIATGTVSVSGGKVTTINITNNGKYVSDLQPTVIITGDGVGATATPKMNILTTGYDATIVWEELVQKRFELDWSKNNNGMWPTVLPSDWQWYDAATGSLSSTLKTQSDAMDAWPTSYYMLKTRSSGNDDAGHKTIVNPYNSKGQGTVPAPTDQEVLDGKFLRADGAWKSAVPTGTITMYAGPLPIDPTSEVEGGGWLLCYGQIYDLATYPQYTNLSTKLSSHATKINDEDIVPVGSFKIPDLRDRFVLGNDHDNDNYIDETRDIGDVGGLHKKTITATNMPAHDHTTSASGTLTTSENTHSHRYRLKSYTFQSNVASTYAIASYNRNVLVPPTTSDTNEIANVFNTNNTDQNYVHSHTINISTSGLVIDVGTTGGNESFDVRPKWIVLGFIIKT